jgi:hypothetical protein
MLLKTVKIAELTTAGGLDTESPDDFFQLIKHCFD